MDAKSLIKIGRESYKTWFDRWYNNEDLENKLTESAMKGYDHYYYEINNEYNNYEKRRMSNKLFIKKLKEELTGFDIYRIEPRPYYPKLLGHDLGVRYTNLKIAISWKDEKENIKCHKKPKSNNGGQLKHYRI